MKFTAEMFAGLARTATYDNAAEKAARILNDDMDPEDVEEVDFWIRHCLHRPDAPSLKMAALNVLLDCYGVEALRREGSWVDSYHGDIVGTYLNTGDAYTETVVYDTRNGTFHLTTYGDWLAR